jgi:23S rRNA 5-hydroxycytidine C2501 synthase
MKEKQKLELLSPARNAEFGKAAINCGADAVYIGASRFGARSAAGNPVNEIESLCRYAHQYHARVFAAVNTILYNNEIEEVRKLIYQLYEAGVDALIIQDMGLLELDLPPIALHASTQTHNYDIDRIAFLDKAGFSRIILARELSLKQIKTIRSQTTAELECFVHGALCVSLSGQCYMSQYIGGRSANRGECAQPCRSLYSLQDENGQYILRNKHLLSLKDLNLSEHLSELADAGACSFKIEGRLKDLAYVKNITAFYRQKLDLLMNGNSQYARTSSGTTHFLFEPDPQRSFSRGFTSYLLTGQRDKIASFDTPKSIGKPVAKVKSINSEGITAEIYEELIAGDGLCFFRNDQLEGFLLNKAESNQIIPNRIPENLPAGTLLYRNADKRFRELMEQDVAQRSIAVNLFFSETENGFTLHAIDEDGTEVSVQKDCEKTPARNPGALTATIDKQLRKSGDTCFSVAEIETGNTGQYFFATSWLNNLRRECLLLLEEKRLQIHKPLPRREMENPIYPNKTVDYQANISNRFAEQFYLKHGVTQIKPAFELEKEKARNLTLMTTPHCLRFETGRCAKTNGNLSPPAWTLSDNRRSFSLEFDCQRCMMMVKRST